jgi:hypothetical protein
LYIGELNETFYETMDTHLTEIQGVIDHLDKSVEIVSRKAEEAFDVARRYESLAESAKALERA